MPLALTVSKAPEASTICIPTLAPEPLTAEIASGVRTDVTGPAVKEIYDEVRGMLRNPMSDEELTAAKDAMINSLPGAFEATSDAVGNFSNVFVFDLGLDYYTKYAAQVKAVEKEQALAMAKKYLPAERLFVVAVGDRAAIEPALRQLNVGPVEVRDATGAPEKSRQGSESRVIRYNSDWFCRTCQ